MAHKVTQVHQSINNKYSLKCPYSLKVNKCKNIFYFSDSVCFYKDRTSSLTDLSYEGRSQLKDTHYLLLLRERFYPLSTLLLQFFFHHLQIPRLNLTSFIFIFIFLPFSFISCPRSPSTLPSKF